MITLNIERIVFVSSRIEVDEVDDFVVLTIDNKGSSRVVLDRNFSYELTDASENTVTQWSDDAQGYSEPPDLYREDRSGTDIFYIKARGILQPGGRRIICIRTTRKGLVSKTVKGISYNDPIRTGTFGAFPGLEPGCITYTVCFPREPNEVQTRNLVTSADGLVVATSRIACWGIGSAENAYKRIYAELVEDHLPIADELDYCLCKLLAAKAGLALNINLNIDDSLEEIVRILEGEQNLWAGLDFRGAISAIERVKIANVVEKYTLVDLAIQGMLKLYVGCVKDVRRISTSVRVNISVAKRYIAQRTLSLKAINNIEMPFPRMFHAAMHHVLSFADAQKRNSHKWTKDVKEKDFQVQFDTYLSYQNESNCREIEIGPGRVDFLLIDTPVEIKVDALGRTPCIDAGGYRDQAADYASRRGCSVAILLVLDTEDRTSEKNHTPHLHQEIDVSCVRSRPGINGYSNTLVVTVVITAFPPKPSDLKTPTIGPTAP